MPARLSMEEVCTARGLRGTLSSHSDLYRMEFDESLIGLGKHPHGVCLRTKGAILSSLVEANALRSDKWLVSRCLLLPRVLKLDEIAGAPRVISTSI